MAPCGNCDVCLNPPVTEDGTSLARLALAAVAESGQRFGAAHIVDLLRGAATEKIRSLGHDRLPAYGRGQAETKEARSEEHTSELQSLMRISYAVFCLKKKKEI